MEEYLFATVSLRSHNRRSNLTKSHSVTPAAPVQYAFISFPFDLESGTLETAGTQGLTYGQLFAQHYAARLSAYFQLDYPPGRSALQRLQLPPSAGILPTSAESSSRVYRTVQRKKSRVCRS